MSRPRRTLAPRLPSSARSGGVAPHQFEFLVQPAGGAAQVVRPWSTATTTPGRPDGGHLHHDRVGTQRGCHGDARRPRRRWRMSSTRRHPRVTSVALTSNLATPQNTGTGITFFSGWSGRCGAAPVQVPVQPAGGGAQVVQTGHRDDLYWTPTTAGTYTMVVWASSAGGTSDAAQARRRWRICMTPPPASSRRCADVEPRDAAEPWHWHYILTAGAGGVAPHQFKFLVQPSGGGEVVQNWRTATTYTWKPETAGTYTVIVWARSAGVTVMPRRPQRRWRMRSTRRDRAGHGASVTPNLASPRGTGPHHVRLPHPGGSARSSTNSCSSRLAAPHK